MASFVFSTLDTTTKGTEFLKDFLSQEFKSPALQNLISKAQVYTKKNTSKDELVNKIVNLVQAGKLNEESILESYIKAPRMWLSFKLGNYRQLPNLKDPASLLYSFGENGWHGPVTDIVTGKQYYIHAERHQGYVKNENPKVSGEIDLADSKEEVSKKYFRWTVIAEVSQKYIAFSWYNFSLSEELQLKSLQFPFWKYVPRLIRQMEGNLNGSYEYPNLYELILNTLWDKYLVQDLYRDSYEWKHLRIRAESSGVALNAKTSPGLVELDIKGLQALSKHLAITALESLGLEQSEAAKKQDIVESAILKTLMKDWGSKSYEFSLDRFINDKKEKAKVFRAHCNFGFRQELGNEDSFLHLKCYSEYGNSIGSLKFLLQEMGM
jgi:hypothetical protein